MKLHTTNVPTLTLLWKLIQATFPLYLKHSFTLKRLEVHNGKLRGISKYLSSHEIGKNIM